MNEGNPNATLAKRCPQCRGLNFAYDHQNNRFICKNCGYSQPIKVFGSPFRKLKEMFKR